MTVYFLRHASAGARRKDPERDRRRGLDRDGIEQATHMGRVLAALESHLDAILASPYKRAAQTAALVANEMGFEGKLQTEVALAPGAALADFHALLARNRHHDAILVVGHNPTLSLFLGDCIGVPGAAARVELRKGGLAKVSMERHGGTLHWLLTPKTVRSVES